jgi:predicted RNA-binding Zn-ribbon protein involved in translation (DUF1610 family)
VDQDRGGRPLTLSVGGVTARCPKCGAIEFVWREPGRDITPTLVCTACKTETPRRALIDQIGQEVMKRANDALEKARKWRADPKDK